MHTILLVDDEIDFVEMLESHLEGPFRILCAHDGQQALEILQKEVVHLMITDYQMPRLNGAQLISQAKVKYPQLKVILSTSLPLHDLKVDLSQDFYLCKPYRLEDLQERISKVLSSPPPPTQ